MSKENLKVGQARYGSITNGKENKKTVTITESGGTYTAEVFFDSDIGYFVAHFKGKTKSGQKYSDNAVAESESRLISKVKDMVRGLK